MKGCATDFAKRTKGYNLPATYIIHTVSPVWYGGHKNEDSLLASCYRESMLIASNLGLKSIAFSVISCGAYRFPIPKACDIAVNEIKQALKESSVEQVIFACFDSKVEMALRKSIAKSCHH